MIEILGGHLKQFFNRICKLNDSYTAKLNYLTEEPYRIEIWSISNDLFEFIKQMDDNQFLELSGCDEAYWRNAVGSNQGVPTFYYCYIKFNNKFQEMICWLKDEDKPDTSICQTCTRDYCDSRDCFHTELIYESLFDYLCNYMGASNPTNVTALSMDLAKANHLTLADLFKKYQPVVEIKEE